MVGRIPVRNLWLLMLYASELTRYRNQFNTLVEADPDDLPDMVARLLVDAVDFRLRRNLTRSYRDRQTALTRVRGRIDILTTEARLLLSRGEVFCRFQELTIDTPRNRLVRAALDLMARAVEDVALGHRCRGLASVLARSGVGGIRPSRADIALDQMGRNDDQDRFMVALAQLAFELALPTEESGTTAFVAPEREERWVRRLFEKAVVGFARVELVPLGWNVRESIQLNWQVTSKSEGLAAILPRMVTDIVLDSPKSGRRIVVDTKFASILGNRRFGGESLKSGYLYQMYAYVRSQEGNGIEWDKTAGLFLHPSVDGFTYEHAEIQGHTITFATINLRGTTAAIREELRTILNSVGQRGTDQSFIAHQF
ncbi:5-methylcytosine-specific restriction endonuclease system specificity protein McrC [Granulicella mallensis]|nr:5-methylcytosine-specific restriction endonuclease system specificity protein McrC [Granulicella mallensis]